MLFRRLRRTRWIQIIKYIRAERFFWLVSSFSFFKTVYKVGADDADIGVVVPFEAAFDLDYHNGDAVFEWAFVCSGNSNVERSGVHFVALIFCLIQNF